MKNWARPLIGLIIIALGVGFLLQAMGIAGPGQVIGTWWPLIIVAVGILSLQSNPRQWIWPVCVILIGIVLQLRQLGVVDFSVWQLLWPALLILFGISVFLGRSVRTPGVSNEDSVDLFVAFSGIDARNTSHKFEGGKITAIFGGVKLDLRDAKPANEAKLEIFTMFGGTELRVPEDWRVHVNGLPILGGWDDKTLKTSKDGPLLEVRGTVMFGGVEVKN